MGTIVKQIKDKIQSGNVAPELREFSLQQLEKLEYPTQEDRYINQSSSELIDMFQKREILLKENKKNYGGISETISQLKRNPGDVDMCCFLSSGYHYHFVLKNNDIIGIVYVEQ